MKTLILEKIPRILKNKDKLEKKLDVKITNRGKELFIEGLPEDEFIAEQVIDALEFGFPFSVALLIKDEENIFEIIPIKNHTKRKDLRSIRARIIGEGGKTLRTLSELTKCNFELKDNEIGIIAEPEYIKIIQNIIISLIKGTKTANVYAYLEKHKPEPVFDFGLREKKKRLGEDSNFRHHG